MSPQMLIFMSDGNTKHQILVEKRILSRNFQQFSDSMSSATSYADTQKLLKHSSPNLTNNVYTNVNPVLRHAVDASFARHTAISARRVSQRDVQRRPDFSCIKDGRCFYVELSCNCKDAATKVTGLSGSPPTKIYKVNNRKEGISKLSRN